MGPSDILRVRARHLKDQIHSRGLIYILSNMRQDLFHTQTGKVFTGGYPRHYELNYRIVHSCPCEC